MNTIIYTQEDEIRLKNELKTLVDTVSSKGYNTVLLAKKFKYLQDFINFKTPLLQDKFYKRATKIYWILNDISDFPKCKQCGKKLDNRNIAVSIGYPSFCSYKCSSASTDTKEKMKQTCLKKYGVEHVYQHKQFKEKYKQTCLEKYGTTHPKQNEQFKEKLKTLCLEKYGVECITQTDVVKEKSRLTFLQKYGVERPAQNRDIRIKSQHRYCFENINFDSMPELAVYIYLKDNNIDFEYQPAVDLVYEYDGKQHQYMPDFKIGDDYIEIKGDQFVDKTTGNWKNPWNSKLNNLYETKHQCCLQHNIKIWYTADYTKYIKYVVEKYGKLYMQQFKRISVTH